MMFICRWWSGTGSWRIGFVGRPGVVFGHRGVCLCMACMVFVGLTFFGAWCIVFLSGVVTRSGKGSGCGHTVNPLTREPH